jgi:hypothetical protein
MSKRVIAALIEDIHEQLTANTISGTLIPALLAIANNDAEMPDNFQVHPVFTAGDFRSVGSFWTVDWLLTAFVSAQAAAMSAAVCGSGVIEYIDGPEDLAKLVLAAEASTEEALSIISDRLRAALPARATNWNAVDLLKVKMVGVEAEFGSMLERMDRERGSSTLH